MGLFGTEKIRVINFTEDYKVVPGVLSVEQYASDVITKKKNGNRDKSWELAHPLMKRCYGIPGVPDGEKALLICARDVVFNPLNQFPELYNTTAIRQRKREMAREQAHKAEKSSGSGAMNVTMILLASSALLLFIAILIAGVIKFYKG